MECNPLRFDRRDLAALVVIILVALIHLPYQVGIGLVVLRMLVASFCARYF